MMVSVAGWFLALPTGMAFDGMDCIRLLFWVISKEVSIHSIRLHLHE